MAKRRQLFFGILIALIVIGSIVFYFWGKVLNRGTILIYMDPPFVANFYERKEVFECDKSPCKIVQPIGEKSFFVSKEGCDTVFASETIKLWRTVEKKIEMKKNPHFLKIEDEFVEILTQYDFAIDSENKMQKLFNKDDPDKKAIVYFPKELKEPLAFGDEQTILVIDKANTATTYKINVEEKNKELLTEISQFKNITAGKWSNDGKFFVASILRQPNLWMMNDDGLLEETALKANLDLTTWINDHQLAIANKDGLTLYDPVLKQQESIIMNKSLTDNPSKIFTIDNGQKIYVKAGDYFYQLILE